MAKKGIQNRLEDAINNSFEQISGQDATFLYAESPSSPMHIATLVIVEGSLKFEDFKAVVASKLHLIPKFRKRLLNVPMNLDYPYWVDDPNFDIDLHINRVRLPEPANWKTLREMTSSIFSNPLDLRRPLWSIDFIEGLDDVSQVPKGSVAIISKVHHVMVDGASGVEIMGILFDKSIQEKDLEIPKPKPFEPEPLPDEMTLLLKSSYGFFKNPFKIPKLASETALYFLKGEINMRFNNKKYTSKNNFSTPNTIFNKNVSPRRTWGTAILSFERINSLRKIAGVTVNDLILTICAGGIRRYLEERDKLPSQPLVANVPISIRGKDENKQMNNQISNMLIKIATHLKDPIERLEYIHEQTNLGKNKHKAVGAKTLSKISEAVPFGLANLATTLYSKYNIKEFHKPPFNVTITNVPGPQNPLYLRGQKILSIFGLTPVLDGFGLIIAAFSYNGLVSITTTSDAKTMPDADKFSRYIREAANELETVVLERGKVTEKQKVITLKSNPFLNKFKKFLIENSGARNQLKGCIDFQITTEKTIFPTQFEISESAVVIKKTTSENPFITVEIEDLVLSNLYRKKLLLKEVLIQERIKISGTTKNKEKFSEILTAFFNQN